MNKIKNIGIDAHMIGDRSGGNESYYTNLLDNLYPTSDMKITLFLNKDIDDTIYRDRFKIVKFKSSNAFIRNFIELPKLVKKYSLDILHVQYFIPFLCPCKLVCTIHDICFEHYSNIFTKGEYLRQKILIPYAAKHSNVIITVSNYSKKDIVNVYNVAQEKIIVAPSAVGAHFCKLDTKKLDENNLRKQYNIGNNDYILSVGNLQPRKNLPRLIRAFSEYKKEYSSNIKLVIVGKKAWMYDDIIREATGETDSILFTDYVSNDDLVRLYNAAKGFIYPSFFEGFGLPPLEAMACGTPVAVSNCTSLPEVVGDGGIYFDPYNIEDIKNSIHILADTSNISLDLYERMQKRVRYFSWKRTAEQIINSYNLAYEN